MTPDLRLQFPALQRIHNGRELVFLDGPAGVQVPHVVIDSISHYYKNSNANGHGAFITTQETDVVIDETRSRMATFLGAEGPNTISFGQNMTTLNFSLSQAIRRALHPGDEIVITQLDHESNRGPWLELRDKGIVVREVRLLPTGELDYEDFASKINERTRLVAMGYAANIFGTINKVKHIRKLTYEVGAWLLVDAVHYAPHLAIDVQAIGCDFLLCSAYKFYGPHVGILYTRPGLLDRLRPDRLRTAAQAAPYSIETGTLNHAALAGVRAAVDFIASLGTGDSMRAQLLNAMAQIHQHEIALAAKLYNGLSSIKGVELVGPPVNGDERAPTLSFTLEGKNPKEVCTYLASKNICAWAGHFYALRAVEVLGLLEQGGVTRMGMSVYNLPSEIDYTLEAIAELAK
ncbi:MAG: cysteine desulfurase-like protein [Saprospiraceae bacterium]|nr:cysteine desulfurase-like protein [Saprospiraceae bacterium]